MAATGKARFDRTWQGGSPTDPTEHEQLRMNRRRMTGGVRRRSSGRTLRISSHMQASDLCARSQTEDTRGEAGGKVAAASPPSPLTTLTTLTTPFHSLLSLIATRTSQPQSASPRGEARAPHLVSCCSVHPHQRARGLMRTATTPSRRATRSGAGGSRRISSRKSRGTTPSPPHRRRHSPRCQPRRTIKAQATLPRPVQKRRLELPRRRLLLPYERRG